MIDIFYYYFYLAYKNVRLLYSPTPRATAAWSVGVLLSFLITAPLNVCYYYKYNETIDTIWLFSISIVVFILSLYIYIIALYLHSKR